MNIFNTDKMIRKYIIFLFINLLLVINLFSQNIQATYSTSAICAKATSIVFTFSPAASSDLVRWDFGDGNIDTSQGPQISHTYFVQGNYTVQARNLNTNAQANLNITVYDKPNLVLTYHAPSVVCAPEDSVKVIVTPASFEHPSLHFTINWGDGTSDNGDINSLGKAFSHAYHETSCGRTATIGGNTVHDQYLIILSATNVCSDVAPTITVKTADIKSKPVADFEFSDTLNIRLDSLTNTYYFCDSGLISVKNKAYGQNNCLNVTNVRWQVYDPDGNLILTDTSKQGITAPLYGHGTYHVILSQQNVCGTSQIDRYFTVRKPPQVGFMVSEMAYCYPTNVTFLNTSQTDLNVYIWDFTGDSSKVIVDSSYTEAYQWAYTEKGDYKVRLWGDDGYCVSEYDSVITLDRQCQDIYVPNAFIPGSSNPLLNTFRPKAKDLIEYRIDIYDLHGRHLWSSTALNDDGSPAEGWDGTYKGRPCPAGTYIWKIHAVMDLGQFGTKIWEGQVYKRKGDKEKRATTGTFVLIR